MFGFDLQDTLGQHIISLESSENLFVLFALSFANANV